MRLFRSLRRRSMNLMNLNDPDSPPPEPITPFDRRMRAAEGYIELGMFIDANAEINEIEPDERSLTEVLALRVRIYQKLEKWDLMISVAQTLTRRDPENVRWIV